jgi:beta-phosphoglucomutase family hydrolase
VGIPIKAAIFDFDGTLVDTMPLHYEAYRQVFAELGLELTRRDYFENIGGKASETIPRFLRGRTVPISNEEIHKRKKAIVLQLLAVVPVTTLESARLVPLLRPHIKIAIASSGSRAGIEMVLGRLGWSSLFDAVVTGDDVVQGKPAPECFLKAASLLGVEARACLVFEDTDDGVEAARSAGMDVFDVRRATAPPWSGAA